MYKRFGAALIILALALSLSAYAADTMWQCGECGRRVPKALGDVCPYCGTHRHIHTWREATCTEPKTCTECGETEGAALGHQWDEGAVIREATCCEDGLIRYTCTVCGAAWEESSAKDPANHAGGTELKSRVDATCTTDGYTGNTYCLGCGALISVGNETPALGHLWQDATFTVPKTCARCGETEGEKLALEIGSTVVFGHYPQTVSGRDNTPIEWIVLDRNDSSALLVSRYGLDVKRCNEERTDVTWETCTLRAWLNREFLNAAFGEKEQAGILLTDVDNGKKQGKWSADGGKDTQDMVFLLSYAEANRYLGITAEGSDSAQSRLAPTAYAKTAGAWTSNRNRTADGETAGWWWLRSPGRSQNLGASVDSRGSLYDHYVSDSSGCVRPAIWVNLGSGAF